MRKIIFLLMSVLFISKVCYCQLSHFAFNHLFSKLFISKVCYCQLSDTLLSWSLANDTSPTYTAFFLKAKGERFGNKLTNISYANGFQKIAAPNGGWSVNIDTTATAAAYIDFPFGLKYDYTKALGCDMFNPRDFILSAYTDATNDSIKITPYLYDSSLYVDSTIFFFWDTMQTHNISSSCGGWTMGDKYYKYVNGHWYYYQFNFLQNKFDSSLATLNYQSLYHPIAMIEKGDAFFISSNSLSSPNNILNNINSYININTGNARLLFLRLYISSSNSNANLYINQLNMSGGLFGLLPISFNSFTATKNNNNVQLNWSMKDETNIDKYVVEKAVSKDLFKPIKTIAISNNKTSYSCMDESTVIGENLYRIKAISKDGKITYSNTLSVLFGTKYENLFISPNPVKEVLNVQIKSKTQEKVLIQIVDVTGKIVLPKQQQLNVGENVISINTATLSKGIYSLVVVGSNSQSIQFVKE